MRVVEWEPLCQHGEQYYAHTPDICLVPAVGPGLQELRCSVVRTTASGLQFLIVLVECSHAEINDLDVSVLRKEYVLRLEVAVANVEGVAVFHGAHYLAKDVYGVVLAQGTILVDPREHVPRLAILEDDIAGHTC